MPTPPHPGTAVKRPAFSIVSRMKRRLSAARTSKRTGSEVGSRKGRTVLITEEYTKAELCQVLCTAKFNVDFGEGIGPRARSIEWRQSQKTWREAHTTGSPEFRDHSTSVLELPPLKGHAAWQERAVLDQIRNVQSA